MPLDEHDALDPRQHGEVAWNRRQRALEVVEDWKQLLNQEHRSELLDFFPFLLGTSAEVRQVRCRTMPPILQVFDTLFFLSKPAAQRFDRIGLWLCIRQWLRRR